MFGALKSGFRSLATLKLVVNVVGELQTEKNQLRHRAVHGFLVSFTPRSAVSNGRGSSEKVERWTRAEEARFEVSPPKNF